MAETMKVHVCSFTTHRDLFIDVEGQRFRFEFSAQFGPFLLGKRGHLLKNQQPTARFLDAVTLWWQQGGKLNGNIAIWTEPDKEILYHLGGRNYTSDRKLALKFGALRPIE